MAGAFTFVKDFNDKKFFTSIARDTNSGYSMSVNATNAYENGIKPLSAWNSRDAKDFSEIIGYEMSLKDFRQFLKDYGEKGYHHTSKMYNKTIFYSIAEAFLRGDVRINSNKNATQDDTQLSQKHRKRI